MKKQLLFIFLIISGFLSFGQNFQWATRIGGESMDIGESIIIDESGYIYTIGSFNGGNSGSFSGNVDFDPGPDVYYLSGKGSFITKSTPAGKFLWAQSIPGAISSIKIDQKGNIFATGQFQGKPDFNPGNDTCILNSEGESDVYILKLNMYGKFVFAKRIGGKYTELSYLIELDKSGNIYTTGYFNGLVDFDPGTPTYKLNSNGYFNLKLDSSGSFSSVNIVKFNPNPLVKDASGNTYETGCFNYTQDFDRDGSKTYNLKAIGEGDAYILKMDSSGKFTWAIGIGGKLDDCGMSLKVDANQNVYLTGYFEDSIDLDPGKGTYYLGAVGKKDVFIAKYDSKGNFLWGKSMGGVDNESGTLLVLDDSSNIYTTGYFEDNITIDTDKGKLKLVSAGNKDIFIVKMNKAGKVLWAKKIGGTEYEEIRLMVIDKEQNLYATGHFAGTVDFDPYVAKFIEKSKGDYWPDAFILKLGSCPSPAEAISGPTLLCPGEKATYSISPASDATGYKWTVPSGTNIDSGQNSNVIHITFGKAFGNITVIPFNICDTNNFTSLEVKSRPLPKVGSKASPSFPVCKGSSITLTGTGAITYTWSGGIANGMAFKPDTTSRFIVTASDINGCSDTNSILIKVNPLPKVGIIASPSSPICKGSSIVLTGKGAASYIWSGGIKNGGSFSADTAKKYIVSGTDINGCKDTSSIYIQFIPNSEITLQPISKYVTVGDTVKFIIASNAQNPKFQWQGQDGSSFYNLQNSVSYSGVTNDTFSINNVKISQWNQAFRCIVKTSVCTIYSITARILFDPSVHLIVNNRSLNFKIYPNPVKNLITIESNHTLNNEPYIITDQTGRQILKGELNSKTNQIDISTLANGFYFLQIGELNKEIFKIMKQ